MKRRAEQTVKNFKPYLHRRWNNGCTNAAELFHEIQALGYRGKPQVLRQYLRPFRATGPIPYPRQSRRQHAESRLGS